MNHINSKNHFKFLLPVYYTKYLVLLALKLYYTTKKYIYFYYFYFYPLFQKLYYLFYIKTQERIVLLFYLDYFY